MSTNTDGAAVLAREMAALNARLSAHCAICGHQRRWHTNGGTCQGSSEGLTCYCVHFPDSPVFSDDIAHGWEWRVRWKREGSHWQQRILQTEAAASAFWVALRTDDVHSRCDVDHQDCLGELVAGPIKDRRRVGDWRAE